MNNELISALEALEKEKKISKDIILEAIEASLVTAYKKDYGSSLNVRAAINRNTGAIKMYVSKTVVEEVTNPQLEMTLEEAYVYSGKYEIGDIVEYDVTPDPKKFGRIAAQTAKQVIVQRLREAEREMVYDEFSSKEGELVSGNVSRIERAGVIVEIGTRETMLVPEEQIPGEKYTPGQKIKLYVVEVRRTTKGPRVVVSRSNPGLIRRLMETEIPEIYDGTVVIKGIARDAGSRSKVAVYSTDENVDAIGSCVGTNGSRIQAVMDEVPGEKIEIIKYSDDPVEFIKESLSPTKVVSVEADAENRSCKVIVPEYQLSLAIGRKGQNACLAAKLTGWKIDIQGDGQTEQRG